MNNATRTSGAVEPKDLEDDPRKMLAIGSMVALLFFVVFIGWAAVTRLDAAAYGEGQVIVAGDRQVVQHRYGGNVASIMVREGQRVSAGDELIRLSGSEVAASERALAASVIGLQAQQARLSAEVSGRPIRWPASFAGAPPEDRPLIEEAVRLQSAQSTAHGSLLVSQRNILAEQRDSLAQQIRGFEAQVGSVQLQRRSLQAQTDSTRRLAERGDVSRNTVSSLERSLAELDGNAADLASRAAATREQIAGTREQIQQTRRKSADDAIAALHDTQFQLNDAIPKWIAAKEQMERTRIRAPVSGRIVGLKVQSAGAVVTAGQPILDIVPDRVPLEIRARFAPDDIDGVYAGREAEIRFLSLHDRDLPILLAHVRDVSADSLQDERTGLNHFTARIVVSDDQVALLRRARGADSGIRPGVPVQVVVKLRKRTALQYMLEPLADSFSRSFGER